MNEIRYLLTVWFEYSPCLPCRENWIERFEAKEKNLVWQTLNWSLDESKFILKNVERNWVDHKWISEIETIDFRIKNSFTYLNIYHRRRNSILCHPDPCHESKWSELKETMDCQQMMIISHCRSTLVDLNTWCCSVLEQFYCCNVSRIIGDKILPFSVAEHTYFSLLWWLQLKAAKILVLDEISSIIHMILNNNNVCL